MVPGFTDTECRLAEFRYRELLAEGDRQRRVASGAPVPAGRVRAIETVQHHIGAAMQQFSHRLHRVCTHEAPGPAAAPGTVAMN